MTRISASAAACPLIDVSSGRPSISPQTGISRLPCAAIATWRLTMLSTSLVGTLPPFFFARSVRSGGCLVNNPEATPSPVAFGPWHVAQYFRYLCFPSWRAKSSLCILPPACWARLAPDPPSRIAAPATLARTAPIPLRMTSLLCSILRVPGSGRPPEALPYNTRRLDSIGCRAIEGGRGTVGRERGREDLEERWSRGGMSGRRGASSTSPPWNPPRNATTHLSRTEPFERRSGRSGDWSSWSSDRPWCWSGSPWSCFRVRRSWSSRRGWPSSRPSSPGRVGSSTGLATTSRARPTASCVSASVTVRVVGASPPPRCYELRRDARTRCFASAHPGSALREPEHDGRAWRDLERATLCDYE